MLLDILLGVLTLLPVPGGGERRRARKLTAAVEAGQVVSFEGSAIGDRPYCRPTLGFLSVSRSTLAVAPTEEPGLNRRPVPLVHLELVRVRERAKTDPAAVRRYWQVAECRDRGEPVLFACSPAYMPLLTATLREPVATG
ncbi:hypothetical protein ACGFX4_03925 [Kitasatospora sp. NPDC048365]|uniref:hypothetical protein n=1 Tax=Kitasatospora sp. NPDC048365 TaxID=3364050 RepID=UPI003720B418